jgi:hypothetical protein
METHLKSGGRRVELFAPYTSSGKQITAIEIAPVKLDHVIRWDERKYTSQLMLLSELSGLPEMTLRQMTYPDVDRVLTAFWGMLPPAILNNLSLVTASPMAPPPAEEVDPELATMQAVSRSNVVPIDDEQTPRTGFSVG